MPFDEDVRPLGPALTLRMPPGGYTVADLLAMPESPYRIELTNGALTVSPSPSGPHQFLAGCLFYLLYQASPDGYTVNQAVDVQLCDDVTRIPDVLIAREGAASDGRIYQAEDVVVAIEIESPTSRRNDCWIKPMLYAEHGIPYYWRIELEPEPIAIVHRWENGTYSEFKRGTKIEVIEPFHIQIDLAEMLDPKA